MGMDNVCTSFLTNQNAFFKKSVVWNGLILIKFKMSLFELKINFTQMNSNIDIK